MEVCKITTTYTSIVEDIFTIAKGITLKRDVLVAEMETLESETNYRVNYIERVYNKDDINLILSEYVEMNNYLRSIAGLPPYGEVGLLYDGKYISRDFKTPGNITEAELKWLYSSGVINTLIEENPDIIYLNYLIAYANPITVRASKKFDPIILTDDTSALASNFNDILYQKIRYFRRWIVNEFMGNTYTYYEPMICIMIIMSVCVELLSKSSPLLTNTHLIKEMDFYKIFKSYDLPFWDLPRSLREKFVDRIKLLIQSASSKKVVADLTEIFGSVDVYKYLIYKSKRNNKPNVEFVRVPHDENNYEKYLGNKLHTFSYDDIVKKDPIWSLNGETFIEELYESSFTVLNSKYMSIENMIDLSNSLLEMHLFFSFMFTNETFSKKAIIEYNGEDVSLFDFLVYASSMVCLVNGYEDDIPWALDSIAYIVGLNTNLDQAYITDLIREYNASVDVYGSREDDKIVFDTKVFTELNLSPTEEMMTALTLYDKVYDLLTFIKIKLEDTTDREYYLLTKIYELITKSKALGETFKGNKKYSDYLKAVGSNLYYRYLEFKNKDDDVITGEEMELVINKLEEMTTDQGFLDATFVDIRYNSQEFVRKILLDALRIFKSHTVDLFAMQTNYILPEDGVRFIDELKKYKTLPLDEGMNINDKDYIIKRHITTVDTTSFVEEFFKIK